MPEEKPVEILPDHIAYVTAVANRISKTSFGQLAGRDELVSEAYVILWELALKWDESYGIPFIGYLGSQIKYRLIDWLRREYGRAPGANDSDKGRKLYYNITMSSLDDNNDWLVSLVHPDTATPEEVFLAKEELEEVLAIAYEECTDRERDALLWPVFTNDVTWYLEKWSATTNAAHTHRAHAKKRVKKVLAERAQDGEAGATRRGGNRE